jgi:predicted amidohydrolase YtcJ
MSEITVYLAKRIHTMNASVPIATAVAVRDGRIIEVGSQETLEPWLRAQPYRIDDRFRDCILMPGFIDPHLHPTLGAILLPVHFITALEWRLPWGTSPAVTGRNDYLRRLKEIHESLEDRTEPLVSWGYHRIWHGELSRDVLDEITTERPIVIWQRSFHEMFLNSAALEWLEIDEAEVDRHPMVDIARGRFFEQGKNLLLRSLNPFLLNPTRFKQGLERLKQVVRFGGHTTIGDMGIGAFDMESEWSLIREVLEREDTPFRISIVPRCRLDVDVDAEMDRLASLPDRNTHRLQFGDHIKMMADGGFFGEMMQVLPPGFIDGHEGEWIFPPEQLEALCRAGWHRGSKIHIHCTGDLGVELALDILEKLQWERPRFDHRFTIEHFGMSTPEQCRRIAALGAQVSANPYYVHELGEAYWQNSIGMERASQMVRLGTLERHGIPFALHSDLTMAPALPLNNAWVAVNRIGESGRVLCEGERITVDRAMRAITIDAAYILGLENEIGSIRAGKRADFTVLRRDPYEVPEFELKDVPIWGVVFEGTPYEKAL